MRRRKFGELRRLYEAKVAASGATAETREMTKRYFDELGAAIRRTAQARITAEPHHIEQLAAFAERAYRRPMQTAERHRRAGVLSRAPPERPRTRRGHSRHPRQRPRLAPRPLPRGRARTAAQSRIGEHTVAPLTDYALANRLSYFLWSSMPDAELLAHAAAGDLHRPEVLRAQARRMLRDGRISRLATEFGTNWLAVRRFEEYNSVDRERFPTFTNDLRRAFFEEPVRFLTAVIGEDRPVTDLLFGDYTYVNRPLASHYGMPPPEGAADRWVRVDKASRYQRGGLLPMAVFLTQTSPGQRTSPVKRGYWIARNVLGQHIPAPPPDVPAIPSDEAQLGNLTLAQTMARHRADPNCASCHATFDFFGLAFEGYGPVGERRERDLGGRTVDPTTEFPDGVRRSGSAGILDYVRTAARQDFVDNLSRRLVSYALGPGVILSDRKLLGQMPPACEATAIDSAASSKRSSPARSSSQASAGDAPVSTVPAGKVRHRIMIHDCNAASRSRRTSCAAPASPCSSPGWNRSRCGAPPRRPAGRRSPGVSPSCSWPTASTRTTGGRKAPARRWSWDPRSSRCSPSASG